MKIKLKYLPHDLWEFFKEAVHSFFMGVFRILWTIVLLVANIARWIASEIGKVINKAPVLSVCITFVIMLVVVVGVHMQMKTKLTTTQWQRDSLEQKLDSIKVLSSDNTRYFRYQEYKEDIE